MSWILVPFGMIYCIVIGLAIVVPYLRGRAHLITTWNLFLLGSINFIGISAVQAATAEFHYGIYDDVDYLHFVVGGIAFVPSLFLSYYRFKYPRRLAEKWFQKWPSFGGVAVGFCILACFFLGLIGVFMPPVQGVAQILAMMARSAALIAFALALAAWLRQPANPFLMWILIAVFLFSLVFSLVGQSGRRDLLSLVMTVPVCWYWLTQRQRSPLRVLTVLAILGFIGLFVLAGYSSIRHRKSQGQRGFALVIESIRRLPSAIVSADAESLLGGDTADASLITIHHYYRKDLTEPFFSLYWLVTNPIPRAFWPEKPVALGIRLPEDADVYRRLAGTYSLGPGIIGHGYHEGGLHMLVFYGLLLGAWFRFMDELLMHQRGNPYLVAMLAASSGQIFALSRGEFGLFLLLIIAVIGTGMVVFAIAKLLFGVGVMYVGDHEVIQQEAPLILDGQQ